MPVAITSGNAGSAINTRGDITNSATIYTFPAYKKKGTLHDLFNHIYFSGDELFFSFTVTGTPSPDNINVFFINPDTSECYAAERLEYKKSGGFFTSQSIRVYGFSLVGSLFEKLYFGDLKKPIPPGALCCRPIPVNVRIVVKDGEKKLSKEIETFFTIKYK